MKTKQKFSALIAALSLALAFSAAAAPKVGDLAPLVSGKTQDKEKWKLEDDIGKSIVLLYFYPKDDTPGCTKEACGLRDKMNDLKAQGVKVVGVSFDDVDSHKRFMFKYDLNFTLVADPSGKIADTYGARMKGDRKMDRRVSFLIGLDGRIIHVTDNPSADVHLEEMQRAIHNLNGKGNP